MPAEGGSRSPSPTGSIQSPRVPPRLPLTPVLAALSVFVTRAPLAAQAIAEPSPWSTSATIDLGAASVEYDDYARASVGTIAPGFGARRGRLALGLRGAISRFETGNMSGQAEASANWVTPAAGPLRGELSGTGGVQWYRELNPGVNDWLGAARLHLTGTRRAGAWLGGGVGQVVLDVGRFGVRRAEVGGWAGAAGRSVSALVQRTIAEEVRYTDFTIESRWVVSRLELAAGAGLRRGDVSTSARDWVEGSATWWLGPRAAVALGAGRYPADVARGAPGGNYAALTLRFSTERVAAATREAVARTFRTPPAQPPPVPVANGLRVREIGRGAVRLVVDAPLAERVELMGDFTEWEPMLLTRDRRGGWTTPLLRLEPGIHRVNVRVDGGPWGVPPGMPHAADDFGSEAGLFVVR